MASYKLTYFDIRARGEMIRMLFSVAGVQFEDERIKFEDWPARKLTTPSGQLPYLTVDGKIICQSYAIARYLAGKFGLAGKTAWDKARADMVVDAVEDMVKPLAPALVRERDPDKKNEMRKSYEDDKLPNFLANLEKLLSENGTGYFVGDEMTWADIVAMHSIQWLSNTVMGITFPLDKYPQIKTFMEKMENLPKIKAYLDSRPESGL